MKAKQTLIALILAAVAPLAAQAESRFGEGYPIAVDQAAGVATRNEVSSDYLAMSRNTQRFGEEYPVATDNTANVRTRDEVRSDFLAMSRNGQRFGEAYPAPAYTTTNVGEMHADLR
jgi:hypothetical protein